MTNVASASNGTVTSPTDTETVTAVQSPALLVVKASTTILIAQAGDVVPYPFTVTNPGNQTLTGITVTDANCDAAPIYVSGDTNRDSKLQTSESWIYTCDHTVTQAEVDSKGGGDGDLDNTVTADSTESAPDTDALAIPIAYNPVLSQTKVGVLDKTVVAPDDRADAGDVINYTITATNAGNVTLTNVTVVDPLLGTLSCTPTQPATLLPGASIVCTGSYTLLQSSISAGERATPPRRTATRPRPPSTPNVVPVPQDPKLAIVKTATPTTYNAVDQVISYSYLVTNTGNVTLSGPFTVTDDRRTDEACPVTPPAWRPVRPSPAPPATPSPRPTWMRAL